VSILLEAGEGIERPHREETLNIEEELFVPTTCPRCGGPLVVWTPTMLRCVPCGQNVMR
jgi:hypothetical protein